MHSIWQPSAPRANLIARQQLYRQIREFFFQRDVLEVETPLISQAPVADPNIQPMAVASRWLHTSPEYAMKRMLCAGSGDIYQICKVFREDEAGRRHNPEFSMLEWYRLGWSLSELMREVAELISLLLGQRFPHLQVQHYSYREAFQNFATIDPLTCADEELERLGRSLANAEFDLDRNGWLDIIMSHLIEPSLPRDQLIFMHSFPASQASLAKITQLADGQQVAQRFEVFFNGMELGNGYDELLESHLQEQRFLSESAITGRPIDQHLISAMEHGLPQCSGVAVGLDRILMHALGCDHISQVISFDWERA